MSILLCQGNCDLIHITQKFIYSKKLDMCCRQRQQCDSKMKRQDPLNEGKIVPCGVFKRDGHE